MGHTSTIPIYHIHDFEVSKESFYANDLATHLKEHEFTQRPHRHDFYLCVLFTKGSGTHEIDFNSYEIKPGALFFMTPGQFHSWRLSKDISGYVFFHTAAFYNLQFTHKRINYYPFFANTQNPPVLYLGKQQSSVEAVFKRILKEYRQEDHGLKFPVLLALIDLLYLDLTSQYLSAAPVQQNVSPVYLQKITELIGLIDMHFQEHKTAGEYAALMNITPKHLNRICREMLNKTTTDLIADRTILEAKRMLIHGDKSVKEIAEALGFDDPSYFMRLFKKHSRQSPAAFMKSH